MIVEFPGFISRSMVSELPDFSAFRAEQSDTWSLQINWGTEVYQLSPDSSAIRMVGTTLESVCRFCERLGFSAIPATMEALEALSLLHLLIDSELSRLQVATTSGHPFERNPAELLTEVSVSTLEALSNSMDLTAHAQAELAGCLTRIMAQRVATSLKLREPTASNVIEFPR